jgi:hypothetical protein
MELFDVVALLENIPGINLKKGCLGTIVEILNDDNYLVEFIDRNGVTIALPTLKTYQIMKVYEEAVFI